MDKQSLFILANPMMEQGLYADDEFFTDDSSCIVSAYLFAIAMEELRPDWFTNSKHKQAVAEMKRTFQNYRRTNNLDAVLMKSMRDSKLFDNPRLFEQPQDTAMICLEDLALITSSDPKDKKFVLRTMRAYFKKAFPTSKQIAKNWVDKEMKGSQSFCRPANVLEMKSLPDLSSILKPATGFSFARGSLGLLEENDLRNDEVTAIMDQVGRYVMMLVGCDSLFFEGYDDDVFWDLHVDEAGDVHLNLPRRKAEEIACLNPTLDACLLCSDLFRPVLTQVYMLRKAGLPTDILTKQDDPKVQMLYSIAESAVLPMMAEIRDLTVNTKKVQNLAEETKAELEQRIDALSSDLAKVCRQDADSQNISALKTTISDTERELQETRETASRLEKELEKALICNQKLEACLAESNTRYNAINEQLIDFLEEGGIFIEEDEVSELTDLSKNPSGVRERIGEIAYQKLLNKRVMVVGGHANTYAALSNLFPNWEYYPDDSVLRDTVWAVDAIACITTYVPHRSFIYARDRARSKGIQFIPVPHNGPATICKHLATHIVDDVAVA